MLMMLLSFILFACSCDIDQTTFKTGDMENLVQAATDKVRAEYPNAELYGYIGYTNLGAQNAVLNRLAMTEAVFCYNKSDNEIISIQYKDGAFQAIQLTLDSYIQHDNLELLLDMSLKEAETKLRATGYCQDYSQVRLVISPHDLNTDAYYVFFIPAMDGCVFVHTESGEVDFLHLNKQTNSERNLSVDDTQPGSDAFFTQVIQTAKQVLSDVRFLQTAVGRNAAGQYVGEIDGLDSWTLTAITSDYSNSVEVDYNSGNFTASKLAYSVMVGLISFNVPCAIDADEALVAARNAGYNEKISSLELWWPCIQNAVEPVYQITFEPDPDNYGISESVDVGAKNGKINPY